MTNIPRTIWDGDAFIIDDGKLLRIVRDSDPGDPRDWDNVGTMVCWHHSYSLGDTHEYEDPQDFLLTVALGKDIHQREAEEHTDPENIPYDKLRTIIKENHVMLPLYLYDHSGLRISTEPYSCSWDSRQVGWIYVDKVKALQECGNITEENWCEVAQKYLEDEVQTYDCYFDGGVIGYELYELENGEAAELVEAVGGFYGNDTERNGILDEFTIIRQVNVEVIKMTITRLRVA